MSATGLLRYLAGNREHHDQKGICACVLLRLLWKKGSCSLVHSCKVVLLHGLVISTQEVLSSTYLHAVIA